MDWSIQEIAKLAGTTSRTLRHYDDVGLLRPTRIGSNGYRYYDEQALVRLQRILLLRELGLGLPAIAGILAGHQEDAVALGSHLAWLKQEQARLDRQIASVERTIDGLQRSSEMTAHEMLDGFDHAEYKEEVEQRWGAQAYSEADSWYRGLDADQRTAFSVEGRAIAADYTAARLAGRGIEDDSVQAIARRHYEWIVAGWGGKRPSPEEFTGLGEMYVADERFAAYYGGPDDAAFVRDAMVAFALANLA